MSTRAGKDILRRLPRSLSKTLSQGEKRKAVILFILIVISSFVELLGLATIIPVVGAVVDPKGEKSDFIAEVRRVVELTLGDVSDGDFILFLVAFMVLGFVFKAVFAMGVVFFQTRFSYSVAYRLQGILWSWHFTRSLERMRSKDSGVLMSEITFWPAQYVNGTLLAVIGLLNDVLVLVLIVVGLFAYDPLVFSAVFLLSVIGSLLIRTLSKSRMERYSEIRRVVDPRMNTTLNNAIRGILELLAFNAVGRVRDKYLRDAHLGFRIMSNSAVLGSLPTRMYEVLAAVSVAAAVFIYAALGKQEGVFESLTLLALASYRVMPALSRINQRVMGLRGNGYLVDWMDVTQEAMSDEEWTGSAEMPSDVGLPPVILEVEDLCVGYEALEHPVFEGLNFKFESGLISSVVGPSGCGKSTLLNSLLGLHEPLSGGVYGHTSEGRKSSCYEQDLNAWLSHMAYLPQQPYLLGGTVRENLDLSGKGLLDVAHMESLLERLGLTEALQGEGLDFVLNEGGSNLSGGQQQRLALARAFSMGQPVLILDEATSALDVKSRDNVMDMLREFAAGGRIVILVTHDREVAAQGDVVLDLEQHQMKS